MRGSASKTSLILSPCSHWLHKDASSEGWSTNEATLGTRIHSVLEKVLEGEQVDAADVAMSVEYGEPVKAFIETLYDPANEVSFRYIEQSCYISVADGKYGKTSRKNDYQEARALNPLGVFPGTADVVILVFGDGRPRGIVIDWKSGSPYFARMQLMSLAALANGALAEEPIDEWRLISAKVAPGSCEAGLDFTVDSEALKDHMDRVLEVYRKGPSEPVVGTHCYENFCPHREGCRGIKQIYYSGATMTEDQVSAMTDENLYKYYVACKTSEGVAERRKKAALDEVKKRGRLWVEGKVFEERFRQVQRFDAKALIQLAKSRGVNDNEIDNCTRLNTESSGFRLGSEK